MEDLKTLNTLTNDYIQMHWDNGGSSEFDQSINEISRAKIESAKKAWGSVFMCKLNKWQKTDPDVVEYTGQKVYNFEFDLIIPVHDEELVAMIKAYNTPKGLFNSMAVMADIKAIFDRAYFLGGINLVWS